MAGPHLAAVARALKPLSGGRTGCLGEERALDTNVLGRSCYKFHIKKMRKPRLPGAIRMLIYRGLGPRQHFHVGGSGQSCQGGTETQALGSTRRFCLLALFREVKMPTICMARTAISLCDVGQAKSWPLEARGGSEHRPASGEARHTRPPRRAGCGPWPTPFLPLLCERRCH